MIEDKVKDVIYVKRYANRKLYVAQQGRYVNIPMLYGMLKEGQNISVYCAKKHEDITAQMLGVIYQQMCINQGYVSAPELLSVIRENGPAYDPALA